MTDAQIQQLQVFFAGKSRSTESMVAEDAMLSMIPQKELYGTIQAGCNFHQIWNDASLNNLKRALSAGGDAFPELIGALGRKTTKLQARFVGQIIFNRAQERHIERSSESSGPTRTCSEPVVGRDAKRIRSDSTGELESQPALRNKTNGQTAAAEPQVQKFVAMDGLTMFVPSQTVIGAGPDASVAVRTGPSLEDEQIHAVTAGMTVAATAHCGNWLQISTQDSGMNCAHASGYVQRALPNGLVLLTPKPFPVSPRSPACGAPPADASLEERLRRLEALPAQVAALQQEVRDLKASLRRACA